MTPFRVLWRRRALERACRWTRAELERQQRQRLTVLRRFAVEHSPFYRTFHRGLENRSLDELPILTKAVMMESFDDLVTDRAVRLADAEAFLRSSPGGELFRRRYVVLATSGSTGRRGIFLFSSKEWLTALAMITRPMAWAGLAGGLRRPPRSAMIASTTPWHYSTRISASLSSRLLPALRLDAAEPLVTMVRRLNEWQPDVLAAYPSVLKQLADEQIAGNLGIRLRSVATSAEVLSEETRRRVHLAWGLRVFDTYGATEYAPIFERRTQPLVRYEISDMVRPLDGECECGRKFGLIESVEGRIEDVLYFPHRDGRSEPVPAHPNVFHEVMETVPAAGWQVRQEQDGLSIALAGLQDHSICEPLAVTLRRTLETRGAAVGAIRIRAVHGVPRLGRSAFVPWNALNAGQRAKRR